MPASGGLERLSEDGNPTALVNELNNICSLAQRYAIRCPRRAIDWPNSDVASVGVANIPSGASEAGPLTPGDSYQFSVTADAVH